ncbi:hypothetical protein IQ250_26170, partial [Pseudanabaenaceae cyanobacterium LEGE 13415]|nr:hypothetical protein [Pseudanabaenaceae cyanobacterium LEGE 13415]
MERLNAATDCEQISNELRSELDTISTLLDTTACRPEDVIAFFQQNPDLVDCVFPTSKVGDSVYPVYPGHYNPATQKLTLKGLNELVEA